MSLKRTLSNHWPEYLIECWALACLMAVIGSALTLVESPRSPIYSHIPSVLLRVILIATIVGLVVTLLIQSPWGKRSGAHMNPAITLAFLHLKKIHPWDALFYVVAQLVGGTIGVYCVVLFGGRCFTAPPVRYAITVPGPGGDAIAFMAETLISFMLMSVILVCTTSPQLIRFTGVSVGSLVTLLIIIEAPLSGTSMNPARTLASAIPSMAWQHIWIYLLGPILGMTAAAQLHRSVRMDWAEGCAKLLHPVGIRCIHCKYVCGKD